MEMNIVQVIKITWPIVLVIGGWIYGYGKLNSKIEEQDKRINQLGQLSDQVKQIAKTLNQLVGKVDLFFQVFCKNNDTK